MNTMAVKLTALSLAAVSSIRLTPSSDQRRISQSHGPHMQRAWSSHKATFGSRTMPSWSAWKSERSPRRPSTPGIPGAA